jgi:DNA-directed RNA polymerase subunit RPC12/RpoP
MSLSADLHDVWSTGLPLGLACNRCLHRALIERTVIGARAGNLQCVDTLPFRCTRCGQRDFAVHLFREKRLMRRFMAEDR